MCCLSSPTTQAVLNLEFETTPPFAYSSESSSRTVGMSVSMIMRAGRERLIILPTLNASSVVASTEAPPLVRAASITRSPTGAPLRR